MLMVNARWPVDHLWMAMVICVDLCSKLYIQELGSGSCVLANASVGLYTVYKTHLRIYGNGTEINMRKIHNFHSTNFKYIFQHFKL